MADMSKLRRKKGALGAPPPSTEASVNLEAPETAPLDKTVLDGRSMRKTNRTVQFATRVTERFNRRLREIAHRDNLLLVEVLELALEAYERRHPQR